MIVGPLAVPMLCTNPVAGGMFDSDVPFRKMMSPVAHAQPGFVISPDSTTGPGNPVLMAALATPMTLPRLWDGFALLATFPCDVTGAKAGMSSAATMLTVPPPATGADHTVSKSVPEFLVNTCVA